MGGAGSTLASPSSYSERARLGKQLPDIILQIFFSRADFKDLLSLASIDRCPYYMFTTASALGSLFQRLQVAPSLGSKGEILFAPLASISPGLVKETVSDQVIQKRKADRDVMCMEIAYFYVRIFQIYAALSLTVMEGDPVRRPSLPKAVAQRPSSAIFTGGAAEAARGFTGGAAEAARGFTGGAAEAARGFTGGAGRGMRGGAVQTSGPFMPEVTKLKGSQFNPLASIFRFDKLRNGATILYYEDPIDETKNIARFFIDWPSTLQPGQNVLKAYYEPKKYKFWFTEDVTIETSSDGTKAELKFVSDRSNSIFNFQKDPVKGWVSIDSLRDSSEYIFGYFKDKFDEEVKKVEAGSGKAATGAAGAAGAAGSSGSSGYSGSSGVIAAASGKSAFESFDAIKDIFDDRFKGKVFPKAYCIGRAMTLLMPIFQSELTSKMQPFYSQVCMNQFDFDTTDSMPRPGKKPNANIYLRSLVSLYYDDFRIADGKVTFLQTETGRTDLRTASKQLAKLYNITQNQETFIESSNEFKSFDICEKQSSLLEFKEGDNKLLKAIMNDCINPMLAFQEEHTQKVNALLKEMFDIKNKDLRFQPSLRTRGKAGVNEFGKKAANLLLNYYLKSEALFIRGVLLFERPEMKQYYKRVT